MQHWYSYPMCCLCEIPHMPISAYCRRCDPAWWACGWKCHACGGSCIHVSHELLSAESTCNLCKQIRYHWHEHRKRMRMDKDELRQHQLMTRQWGLELYLHKLRPVKVIARGIIGEDYLKGPSNITWHGLKQISHVAAAIFQNARCNNGAEIQVYKETHWLSYDTRLEDLCDMRRRVELTIVINHSNHQIDGEV